MRLLTLLAFGLACSFSQAVNHDKVVMCYYASWSYYRPDEGEFLVSDIDADMCSHGAYAFAVLNGTTDMIQSGDPWVDLEPSDPDCPGDNYCSYGGYRKFTALKQSNPGFSPILTIGGYGNSDDFPAMAADPSRRSTFVNSVVPFLQTYGFDGLDLDWEFPMADDIPNYNALVMELSEALKAQGLVLTGAIPSLASFVAENYDLETISMYFDYMTVMTYDYHGSWENYTGSNSPLYPKAEEMDMNHPGYEYNVFTSVNYFLNMSVPASKLLIGQPTYGRTFVIRDPNENGLYCSSPHGLGGGPLTGVDGVASYYEIRLLQENDTLPDLPGATPLAWNIVVDSCHLAPYMYNLHYWITYDDAHSAMIKTAFANHMGLAGTSVFSIDMDDFMGMWSQTSYPILGAVNSVYESGDMFDPEASPCGAGSAPSCYM